MYRPTPPERLMLCIFLGLLLAGWAVNAYRTARPDVAAMTNSVKQ
jgi:hypothetical protein